MKRYYELHVTFVGPGGPALVSDPPTGWTYSRIDGDPDLGPGVKRYLTTHRPELLPERQLELDLALATKWLQEHGFTVLRRKVELVVRDDRTILEPE